MSNFERLMVAICLMGIMICILLLTSGCAQKGVIGVVKNQHGVIRAVYPQTPAASTGISEGDFLFNHRNSRGLVGSEWNVKYIDVTDNNTIKQKKVKRVDIDSINSGW